MRMRAAPCRVAVLLVGCACLSSAARAQGGPSSFIERMDANRNGQIEPDEASRLGDLLRRVAEATRAFDPRRPVSVRRLQWAFERYREQRSSGRDRGSDNRDNRGGSSGSSPSSNDSDLEPLVPDFSPETVPLPPPGFGTMADMFVVQVTDEDRRDAEERFRRYDRNRDGRLSSDELRSGRWYDDPLRWDANRDGTLTVDEMAVRYARRRVDRAEQRAQEEEQRQNASNAPSDDRRGRFSRFGFFGSREEGESGDAGEDVADASSGAELPRRTSYRIPEPHERLPLGLPSWFAARDANGDGQVFMSEFSTSWNRRTVEEFEEFDANGDGVILPDEALEAAAAGEVASTLGPSATSSPEAEGAAVSKGASDQVTISSNESAEVSPAPVKVETRTLEYAARLIERYDTNHDGVLVADEWASMNDSPADADADGDGRITAYEYAISISR